MKKMRLDLEQLAVESFATEREGGAERGTVRGHSDVPQGDTYDDDKDGDLGSKWNCGVGTLLSLLRTQCC